MRCCARAPNSWKRRRTCSMNCRERPCACRLPSPYRQQRRQRQLSSPPRTMRTTPPCAPWPTIRCRWTSSWTAQAWMPQPCRPTCWSLNWKAARSACPAACSSAWPRPDLKNWRVPKREMPSKSRLAGLQAIGRQRLVDQAPLGGRAAVDVLAQHGVVHGTAEGQQLHGHLGGAATGQDAPVDFGQAELGVIRGKGQVAGEQGAVAAAEADRKSVV